ncbi:MAG TPA: hypothetical protein VM534_11315 [Thermoanaerobaculia bacterium]|nr:hypothetical protein [Thermoanaerobaculia bacterium]
MDPDWAEAARSLIEMLDLMQMEAVFVGSIAEAAWLGNEVAAGPIDVLALTSSGHARMIPKVAGQHGFEVDAAEIERAEELDLIPLTRRSGEQRIRIHILMATNALYSRMIRNAVAGFAGGMALRLLAPEDLAILLLVDESSDARRRLDRLIEAAGEEMNLDRLNETLASLGLSSKMVRR